MYQILLLFCYLIFKKKIPEHIYLYAYVIKKKKRKQGYQECNREEDNQVHNADYSRNIYFKEIHN